MTHTEALQEILRILTSPPTKRSIPSRNGGRGPFPPDWCSAAEEIQEVAQTALGASAIHAGHKFRRR